MEASMSAYSGESPNNRSINMINTHLHNRDSNSMMLAGDFSQSTDNDYTFYIQN